MRTILVLLAGLVLGAGGVYVIQKDDWPQWTNRWGAPPTDEVLDAEVVHITEDDETEGETTPEKRQAVEVKPYPGIDWEISEIGVDALGVPVASVNLQTAKSTYLIGNFSGDCFDIAGSGWSLATENQVSGVICWWAGGGTEVGIFKEGEKFIARVGDIDEGTAEEPGTRGNFETLFEVEL